MIENNWNIKEFEYLNGTKMILVYTKAKTYRTFPKKNIKHPLMVVQIHKKDNEILSILPFIDFGYKNIDEISELITNPKIAENKIISKEKRSEKKEFYSNLMTPSDLLKEKKKEIKSNKISKANVYYGPERNSKFLEYWCYIRDKKRLILNECLDSNLKFITKIKFSSVKNPLEILSEILKYNIFYINSGVPSDFKSHFSLIASFDVSELKKELQSIGVSMELFEKIEKKRLKKIKRMKYKNIRRIVIWILVFLILIMIHSINNQ